MDSTLNFDESKYLSDFSVIFSMQVVVFALLSVSCCAFRFSGIWRGTRFGPQQRLPRLQPTSFRSLLQQARGDFIDVDVVNDGEDRSDASGKPREGAAGGSAFDGDRRGIKQREVPESDEGEGGGLLGGIVKAVGGGISKLFGQDEQSKKKKARKEALNQGIDKIFDEAGLGGGLLKAAAKGIGGMVTDMVSDLSEDVDLVQDAVLTELERDTKASFALGRNINIGMPFQSSSYSSNVNGIQTKTMQYVMPVAGSKAQAQAEISARMSERELVLESLVISSPAGRIVVIAPGGRRGGGGSSGSVNSRNNLGSGGGSDDVIDVEVM